jgi:hypothetical protein
MSSRRNPIYSAYEDQLELQEAINEFVVALAERIDLLQDLHSSADFSRLGDQCVAMALDAERLGYPLMAGVARDAADACKEGKVDASEQALVEMTEIAQRIRLAHRGAA